MTRRNPWIKARWRCGAYDYPHLKDWFQQAGIRNAIPRWQRLSLTLQDQRTAHAYQDAALAAWIDAACRGSIVLPTGAGKTFVAMRSIHHTHVSTVVVAPTIDLLHQWYARLSHAFGRPVGVYYGAEKLIEPLTGKSFA